MINASVVTLSPVSQAVKACMPAKATYRLSAGVLALSLALSVATPVSADTFTVTNTNDSGAGSLREAIELANSNLGHDTINLSSVSGEITPATNFPVVQDAADIIGAGSETLNINGELRIFARNNTAISISNFSLDRFHSSSSGASDSKISADGMSMKTVVADGNLVISNSLISGGHGVYADFGYYDYNYVATTVHLKNCTITNSTSSVGGWSDWLVPSSNVIIENSLVTNNAHGPGSGSISIIDSVVSNNQTGVSGEVVTVKNSTISGNGSSGISSFPEDYSYTGGVTIENSLIKDNLGDGVGGLLWLRMKNTTVTGNTGFGINVTGGIIANHSTITNNNGGIYASRSYYAFQDTNVTSLTLSNSIVINNAASGSVDIAGSNNIRGYSATSVTFSSIGEVSGNVSVDSTNLLGVDLLLEPLADNGGPTLTHALLPGSPAIDAGDLTSCLAEDQRGVSRPQGNDCDIGAYEARAAGTAIMGDTVWEDLDGDGVQGSHESGLPNVSVDLLSCDGALLDATTSNAQGIYRFNQLTSGQYKLRFTTSDGYHISPEKSGSDILRDSNANPQTGLTYCYTMTDGQKRTAIDVGMVPTLNTGTGVMGDYIWKDSNGDGVQDANETGLANVTIDLLTCDGSYLQSTTSDQDGNYAFTQLAEGHYQMRLDTPAGYSLSPEKAAGDYLRDSNVDQSTGLTLCYPLAKGQKRTAIDAGMVPNDNGVTDLVSIVSAIYFAADQRLWVRAESDAQPDGAATLTATMIVNGVETVLGTVGWKTEKRFYQQAFRNVTETPDAVILTSDYGGVVAESVQGR